MKAAAIAFPALALSALPTQAVMLSAEPGEASGIALSVSAEAPDDGLFVQEMLIVTVLATFRDAVALAQIDDPTVDNARVERLGKDRWTRTSLGGPMGTGFERRLAVFPQTSGVLRIDPFAVRATLRLLSGEQTIVTLKSGALVIPVKPPLVQARAWWLPARTVHIEDEWYPDPEGLPAEATARRTVTIEAQGVTAVQLPPLPPMRGSGVITFAHPTETTTTIGPDGPVARAVYRWDVRTQVDTPVLLREMRIPWFDTLGRRQRTAVVPARTVSRVAAPADGPGQFLDARTMLSSHSLVAAAAGAMLGLLVVGTVSLARTDSGRRRPSNAVERAALRQLRRAAARGDARAVREAVSRLVAVEARDTGGRPAWLAAPDVESELSGLDRFLYGDGDRLAPDLIALRRAIVRARRTHAPMRRYAWRNAGSLAALDGAAPGKP